MKMWYKCQNLDLRVRQTSQVVYTNMSQRKLPVEILYFEIRIEIKTKQHEIKFKNMLKIHT
jgi:hypothetical protein